MSVAATTTVQKPVNQPTREKPVRTGPRPVVKAERDPRAGLKEAPSYKGLMLNSRLSKTVVEKALKLARGSEGLLSADERGEVERLLARLERRQ